MAKKILPAKKEALSSAISFLEEELEKIDCPMKSVMQIAVCVEEMFINVASYAYRGTEGDVALTIDTQPGLVSITLSDSGIPFDPLSREDPDVTLSAEDRKIGGLGIFMVKKSMDEVSYRRQNGQNIFTMVKKF